MELRRHPSLIYAGEPTWPPQWNGPYGPDTPLPSGEVGTLVRVIRAMGIAGPLHCILVIEWNQREYCGSLYFDNEASMHRIVAVLQGQIGRPLAEVGSLEIPDFA